MTVAKAIVRSLLEAVFIGTGLVILARLLGGFLAYHAGIDDLEFLGVALLVYVVSMTIYRLKFLGGSR
jgi:hypothetical protein